MDKEYFSEIRNQKIFLEEKEDGVYYLGNKLSSMGEEQKNKSKTGANYYYKREIDNTEFYFKIEGNNCDLTETVSPEEHSIWLRDQRSLSYYRNDEHIVSRNFNTNNHQVITKEEGIKK